MCARNGIPRLAQVSGGTTAANSMTRMVLIVKEANTALKACVTSSRRRG
jgi:hypothetical protein